MTGLLVPKGPSVDRASTIDKYRVAGSPLPDWVKSVFPAQQRAVKEAVGEFARGADVVMLDAPTGSGKTLIADLVRREMQVERGLYVCTTKSLQDQVLRDFPYARVLKGRRNYIPTKLTSRERDGFRPGQGYARGLGVSCADCDAGPAGEQPEDQTCSYCEFVQDCPYQVAKREAMGAEVGVLNTSYLLAECNGPGRFRGRDLVVMDESDLIERELLEYVEVRVAKKWVDAVGVEVPKKGSHMTTIRSWLAEELLPGLVDIRRGLASRRDLDGRREYGRVDRQIEDVRRVLNREEGWTRENDEEGTRDGLVLKPIAVDDVGHRLLWQHGQKWLLMSGTTISAETQAEVLGIEEAGLKWASVEVPMGFPIENRQVTYIPLAPMTRAGQEAGAVGKMIIGVNRVLARHPDVNVLIHVHSYKLSKEISQGIIDPRPVLTYDSAHDRESVLEKFKTRASEGGAVLVAASMDRGIDLPGDLCRVMIVCKVPFASLGSRQVSERLRSPGGQSWYTMDACRTLLQMTGRAVRSSTDYAITYILDESFGRLLKDGKRMGMFPQWWLDALELGRLR